MLNNTIYIEGSSCTYLLSCIIIVLNKPASLKVKQAIEFLLLKIPEVNFPPSDIF